MRLFKRRTNINWKYIVGEILLIFIGINLAIWFNNWNTSQKTHKDKTVALEKIKNEIRTNQEELTNVQEGNTRTLAAFKEFSKIYDGNTTELETTPTHLKELNTKYDGFFRVSDSTELENGLYHYYGGTHIELEIAELTQIAWETTRSLNITHQFNYDCMYELEGMYNLQERAQSEIDRAAIALQESDIKAFFAILNFLDQLINQLLEDYKEMLESLDGCG